MVQPLLISEFSKYSMILMMARLAKLQKTVKDTGLDALLVTHLPHIQYLINYSGSNGLLIVPAQGKTSLFYRF